MVRSNASCVGVTFGPPPTHREQTDIHATENITFPVKKRKNRVEQSFVCRCLRGFGCV